MRRARRRGGAVPHLRARAWALPLALGLAAVTAAGLGTTTGRTLAAWADAAVLPGHTLAAATVIATTTDATTPEGQAIQHIGWPSTGAPLHLSIRNDGTVEHDLVLVVGPLAADGLPPAGQRPRACPGSVWRTATAAVDEAPATPVCRSVGTAVTVDVPVGATTTLVLAGPRSGTAEPLHVVALDSASGRFVDTAVVVDVTQPGDAARTAVAPEGAEGPDEAPAAGDGAATDPTVADAEPASPVQPAETAKPAEPAQPAQPAQPVEPARSGQPTPPADPAGPSDATPAAPPSDETVSGAARGSVALDPERSTAP